LSPDTLERQWEIEFRHHASKADLVSVAFSDSGWEDLEWNAREALHLNNGKTRMPYLLRHIFLSQEKINTHLLRSLQMLLSAWQQWMQLPHVRVINSLPSPSDGYRFVDQAFGRLETAKEKQDSLLSGKQSLQHFSLRQWRYYQQLSAFFNDLEPLVKGASSYAVLIQPDKKDQFFLEDILWHDKELHLTLKHPEYRPGQWERLKAPRLRVNKWLGTNCLYHANLLKFLTELN
jgi:hypothetical protein